MKHQQVLTYTIPYCGIDARFAYTQAARFHKSTTYHVVIEQDVETILQDLNLSFTGIFSLRQYLKNDDEVAGYLSGIFLANGSVNDPESSNYHLEMSSQDITLMSEIHELLTRQKII
ncbi:DNA-binding protein WhiA, partial [Candidatus Nomurabacteria bacterium]|nr:DNA-binding protein WhiA [Candidatus Nomurabacteria bacterium]